jgi:hypothetical protein
MSSMQDQPGARACGYVSYLLSAAMEFLSSSPYFRLCLIDTGKYFYISSSELV